MTSKVESERNLESGTPTSAQLMMMRMLLRQQQEPKFQTQPITDVGSGINSAVGSVVQGIMYRKQQQRDKAMWDGMLANEQQAAQQQQQQAAMASQAGAQQLGVDPQTYGSMTDAMKNSMLESQMKSKQAQSDLQQRAGMVMQNSPVLGTGPMKDPNIAFKQFPLINQQQAQIIASDPGAYTQFATHGVAMPVITPMVAHAMASQNPNTIQGSNAIQGAYGFRPMNSAEMVNQQAGANHAVTDASVAAKFAGPQAQMGLNKDQSTIAAQGAQTNHTNMETSYMPAMNASTLAQQQAGTNASTLETGIKNNNYNWMTQYAQNPGAAAANPIQANLLMGGSLDNGLSALRMIQNPKSGAVPLNVPAQTPWQPDPASAVPMMNQYQNMPMLQQMMQNGYQY